MIRDGRDATQPYRVRVGDIWYWVDPTAPVEPGDSVIIYPTRGDSTLAILQGPFKPDDAGSVAFSTLEGEQFTVPAGDIAALHLAAEDDQQE